MEMDHEDTLLVFYFHQHIDEELIFLYIDYMVFLIKFIQTIDNLNFKKKLYFDKKKMNSNLHHKAYENVDRINKLSSLSSSFQFSSFLLSYPYFIPNIIQSNLLLFFQILDNNKPSNIKSNIKENIRFNSS